MQTHKYIHICIFTWILFLLSFKNIKYLSFWCARKIYLKVILICSLAFSFFFFSFHSSLFKNIKGIDIYELLLHSNIWYNKILCIIKHKILLSFKNYNTIYLRYLSLMKAGISFHLYFTMKIQTSFKTKKKCLSKMKFLILNSRCKFTPEIMYYIRYQ